MGVYFSYGLSIIEPIYFSYKYSLPNKLFEYVMMDIPVIVSDIPEQAGLVKHYNIGLIADLNDPVLTAEQMKQDKADRNAALQKAKMELNWKEEKKKLINVYELFSA